jgi:hypothetical protein
MGGVPGRSTQSLAFIVEMRGTLTAGDFLAAQWLHVKPRRAYAIVGIALLALAAWLIWASFSVPRLRGNAWPLIGSLGFLCALLLWARHKSLRMYRQLRALQREIHFVPTDSGLFSESETGRGTTPWTDFVKWKHGNDLFLLYIADEIFHLIPERFFSSSEDVLGFRELLAAKIGQR